MDLNRLIQARLLQGDLVAVDGHFTDLGIQDMAGIVCLKNAFVALANVVDFERTIRVTYQRHADPSATFDKIKKELAFAKYLRNKFVGHIHRELIDKAVEWRPELRYLVTRLDNPKAVHATNLFILETAINTYVDDKESHKLFGTDTDLVYPPDWIRFVDFLEVCVRTSLQFLSELCAAWEKEIQHPDPEKFDLELWGKAGRTKFGFLTK